MKFAPRHSQIIGRMVIKRALSPIILLSESNKVTKFVLVDAVGVGAAEKGVKVGDIVLPIALGNIIMDDGFRPSLEEDKAAFFVTDVEPGELLVQTDKGDKFVQFDSPEAAQPLGAPAPERELAVA